MTIVNPPLRRSQLTKKRTPRLRRKVRRRNPKPVKWTRRLGTGNFSTMPSLFGPESKFCFILCPVASD